MSILVCLHKRPNPATLPLSTAKQLKTLTHAITKHLNDVLMTGVWRGGGVIWSYLNLHKVRYDQIFIYQNINISVINCLAKESHVTKVLYHIIRCWLQCISQFDLKVNTGLLGIYIWAKASAYQRVIWNFSHSFKFKTDTGIELEDFRKPTGRDLKKKIISVWVENQPYT